MRWATGLIALALVALTSLPASAASEGTNALEICGTLRAHTAATATADGSLRVGSRGYPIASGVAAGNGGVELAVGRDLCVTASIGLASGRLVRYLFFPMLSGDRVCGNIVRPAQADSFAVRADFGELTLLRSTPALVIDDPGMRACYAYQIDRATGDLVATAKLPVRDNFSDREHVTKCGRVNAYVPATAVAPGQITVGSRSFRIAAGTTYTGDPAGNRTDRTAVGEAMCLSSTLDPGGAIVEYLTRSMDAAITATASAYTPPSGGAGGTPGIATLSYQSRFELQIPAALDATIDIARSTYCLSTTVVASGDMAARDVVACPSGGAAGGAGTATPSVAAATASPLSSAPSPTTTASPSASPLTIASPSPTPVVRGESEPVLLIAVLLIASAAGLLTYLVRRANVAR
ncbi:MAG: hypothetical protein M3R54_08680 [Chloroflexota bacterium]|nr:hypothetical protein [Chloroflexota bacterium]